MTIKLRSHAIDLWIWLILPTILWLLDCRNKYILWREIPFDCNTLLHYLITTLLICHDQYAMFKIWLNLNTHGVEQCIFCLLKLNCRWLVNKTQGFAPKCYMLMSHSCLANPLLSLSPTLPFSISVFRFLSHTHKHTVAHMLTPALQFEASPLEMSGCQS